MDDTKDQITTATGDSATAGTTDGDAGQIKKLDERISDLENSWKRALADYKNLERRTAEEKQEFAEFSNMLLIQRLLPVVDNLQMLKKHIGDTGLILIVKEFNQVLEDNGAKATESLGKDFDAGTMDCVETVECEAGSSGKVVEVLTEGYTFRKKILRPAKVRVGKAK